MGVKFAAIGLVTTDMAASLDFYRRLGVGFPEIWDGEDHVEAVLPGGIRLMLDSADLMKQIDPTWEHNPVGVGSSLAFECDSPDEVDDVYASIVAAGYTGDKEPWDAFWGQRYATLLDPAGNPVDLFAPLPAA